MNKASSQKPRVLHLISSSGFLGAEHVLVELALYSKLSGLDVTIGVFENSRNPNYELVDVARKRGLEVKIFPCEGRFDRNTVKMIRDYIKRSGINILHSHNYKSNFFARLTLSSRNNVKWVITNHGRRIGPLLLIYHFINSVTMRRADRVIVVSEEIALGMKKQAISDAKIKLIHNGIDIEKFSNMRRNNHLKRSFGFNGTSKIVGTIASLTPEKGHIYLLEAAKKVIDLFPECRFLIVGDGRERQFLEEKTAHFRLTENVFFTGSRKDVPEILSILDLFILPSLREGLPMALLEAMASKIPVIATSVGAIPKVLENRVSGILIRPKDSQAIVSAITQTLNNRNDALGMAEKGFEKVRDNFSSKKMSDKYLTVYEELLS